MKTETVRGSLEGSQCTHTERMQVYEAGYYFHLELNMPTDARSLSLSAVTSPHGTETESGIMARISHVSFIHSSIKPLSGYWEFIC